MEYTANRISLVGTLKSMPEFSHVNHDRKFYRFELEVPRLSGTADLLPVIVAEDVLLQTDLFDGYCIAVTGQIRSFNSKSDTGRKLIISVYAESMTTTMQEPQNDAQLIGAICKPPIFRQTPLGREICDIMLAVNRPYHRTDYIPCIIWGKSAQQISQLDVGTKLDLIGRLQSRTYIKVLPDGNEQRVAYEFSVTSSIICSEDEP